MQSGLLSSHQQSCFHERVMFIELLVRRWNFNLIILSHTDKCYNKLETRLFIGFCITNVRVNFAAFIYTTILQGFLFPLQGSHTILHLKHTC